MRYPEALDEVETFIEAHSEMNFAEGFNSLGIAPSEYQGLAGRLTRHAFRIAGEDFGPDDSEALAICGVLLGLWVGLLLGQKMKERNV